MVLLLPFMLSLVERLDAEETLVNHNMTHLKMILQLFQWNPDTCNSEQQEMYKMNYRSSSKLSLSLPQFFQTNILNDEQLICWELCN